MKVFLKTFRHGTNEGVLIISESKPVTGTFLIAHMVM